MAKINISNVVVKNNPAKFQDPFQFEITFECIEDLNDDLEWKIIYVGSAESEDFDQTLDTVVVGPIIAGKHMFVFEADPPDVRRIPPQDAVGVTVVLLTCSYQNQEFIRVGYYVNNEYGDTDMRENPPMEPVFNKLQRNILATCPRVTRFKINWGDGEGGSNENQPPAEGETSGACAVDSSTVPELISSSSGPAVSLAPSGGGGEPMECLASRQSENSNTDAPLRQLENMDNSNSAMEVVLNDRSNSQS